MGPFTEAMIPVHVTGCPHRLRDFMEREAALQPEAELTSVAWLHRVPVLRGQLICLSFAHAREHLGPQPPFLGTCIFFVPACLCSYG